MAKRTPKPEKPAEPRRRRIWPDVTVNWGLRARVVAKAYRDAAVAQRERADALQAVIADVDLRVVGFANPNLVDQIKKLIDQVAPDPITALDGQFAEWGEEEWLLDPAEVPTFVYDDDDWVPTRVAAEISGVPVNTLMRMRALGTIGGMFDEIGHVLLRVGEARDARSRMPGKNWRTTWKRQRDEELRAAGVTPTPFRKRDPEKTRERLEARKTARETGERRPRAELTDEEFRAQEAARMRASRARRKAQRLAGD